MIEQLKVRQLRLLDHLSRPVTHYPTGLEPRRFVLAQILVKAGGRSGPTITLRGGDNVTYPAHEWEHIEVEMPDPPSREIVVDYDEAGEVTGLRCPNPSCAVSEIAEVDQSTRWNRLKVVDGVIEVSEADTDHQHVGWVCTHCGWDLTSTLESSDLAW